MHGYSDLSKFFLQTVFALNVSPLNGIKSTINLSSQRFVNVPFVKVLPCQNCVYVHTYVHTHITVHSL